MRRAAQQLTCVSALAIAVAGVGKAAAARVVGVPVNAPEVQPSDAAALAAPRHRLEDLAARQAAQPDTRAIESPDPPGAAAALMGGPVAADLSAPAAREDLGAVLDRYAALDIHPRRGATPAEPAPLSDDDALAASRLYVQARLKYLDNDYAGATADLENAIAIDPSSPTLWLLQGEALHRSGRLQDGMDAAAKAVELGLEHPRPLLLLCNWHTSRREIDQAIHLGGRAVAAQGMGDDPALEFMAWATLADALYAGRHFRAATQAYMHGFDLPDAMPPGTAYAGEISTMYRSGWDALVRAAIASIGIGDWEAAAGALAAASRFPSVDPARAVPLRVLAAMRLGRPADAALAVLDAIEARGAAVDERTLRLIRHLRDHSEAGPLLAAALTELDARVRGRSPSIEASMALAVAAGLADGLDRGPLVEAVQRFPSNGDLAATLLSSFSDEEMDRAIAGAAALADAHPVFAQTIADAMIISGLRTPGVVDTLRAMQDQRGADVLLARLLAESGDFGGARAVLEATGGGAGDPVGGAQGDHAAARRILAATIEMLDARPDAARRLVEAWPTPATDGQRLLRARALSAIGDHAAACDAAGDPRADVEGGAIDPAASTDAARALLQHACQSARTAQDLDAAERLARRLISADPFAEVGYGILIALYSPPSPKADPVRLGEAVRDIRERVPDSTLLRFLSARELAQTGRLAEADARLRALAEDEPRDDAVFRALIEVWQARAARESQAVRFEADAFLSRLAAQHETTCAPSAALAMLRLAQGRPADAADALTAWLRHEYLLTAEDRNRIRAALDPLLRGVGTTADPRLRQGVLGLLDSLDASGFRLDQPQHAMRMLLIAQVHPEDTAALTAAARRAGEQVPALGNDAYHLAASAAMRAGLDHESALSLMREGATRPGGFSLQALSLWAGLIAQIGDSGDLRELFALVPERETLAEILRVLPGAPDDAAATIEHLRADFAYAISGASRIMDRPEQAGESFLRLALELNPEHASAANDLGYQLADRGVNLAEAERLLEMAHRLQPDEPNVLDSLGWLRYKQGRLTDLSDGSGAASPDGAGAISLLERAAALLGGQAGQVTLDQLGDAYWRAGRRTEAWERWNAAIPLGDQTVQAYTEGGAPPSMLEEARGRVERLRAKVQAAEELMNGLGTSEPLVAPLGEGVTEAR